MAVYLSKGTISDMSEVQSGTSKNGYQWQRMTLTLDIPGYQGAITKQVFNVTGDDVKDVLMFNCGDRVEVEFVIYAREWNGKWYNNVDLIKIRPQEQKEAAPAEEEKKEIAPVVDDNPESDLPF